MPTQSFIQVPPDSTGKKLLHQEHTVNTQQMQVPIVHIGCAEHPEHIQIVDGRGQAFVRFAEGSPTMDAFGNLRVAEGYILGSYEYSNGSYSDLFTNVVSSGGQIQYVQQAAETQLVVNTTNSSSASRTSNRYHFYQPGVGNLIINTLALDDNGKIGNTRRWGYYDNLNGFFWELDGTTLSVCIRSNTTGVVIDRKISRLNWNGDKLDGTGSSNMTIDLSKANFFFIDFAWLGVGAVRFGVLAQDGSRWVCHTFQNPNSNIGAYMASSCLPVKYENFNTSVTSGSSYLKLICTAVYAESRVDYTFWRFSDIESDPKTITTNTPILSMRPKLMNGTEVNRIGIYPGQLSLVVIGGNVKISIIDDAILTGATWSINGEGLAEGDNAATSFTGGSKFKTWYFGPGCHNINLEDVYETNDEGYHVLADGSDAYTFTLAATKIDGTSVQVGATLTYRELR